MKFDPKKWIPRFRLLQVGSTMPLLVMAGLLTFLPPPVDTAGLLQIVWPGTEFIIFEIPTESIPAVICVFVCFVFGFLMGTLGGILTQRVMIDVIPNRIRNSVYSLQPTLVMIVAMPFMVISGEMLSNIGFPITLTLLAGLGFLGILLIKKGFSYPIPKAQDLIGLIPENTEEVVNNAAIEELERNE